LQWWNFWLQLCLTRRGGSGHSCRCLHPGLPAVATGAAAWHFTGRRPTAGKARHNGLLKGWNQREVWPSCFYRIKREKRMARTKKKVLDPMFYMLADPARASNSSVAVPAARLNKSSQSERIPIRAGYCSGCNVRIPSRLLQRALAGATIQCEQCSHKLYVEVD